MIHNKIRSDTISELPQPTALGPARPSLVAVGASCFCVGPWTRRGHSGSRLRRRSPFISSSECPAPADSTLGHNRRCTLLVAFEHRRRRGERLTTLFDRWGSNTAGCKSVKNFAAPGRRISSRSYSRQYKAMPDSGNEIDDGRCIPSLLAPSTLAEEGGLAPCTAQIKHGADRLGAIHV